MNTYRLLVTSYHLTTVIWGAWIQVGEEFPVTMRRTFERLFRNISTNTSALLQKKKREGNALLSKISNYSWLCTFLLYFLSSSEVFAIQAYFGVVCRQILIGTFGHKENILTLNFCWWQPFLWFPKDETSKRWAEKVPTFVQK